MPSFLHLEGARHVRVCLTFVLLRFEQRWAKKLLLDALIFIKIILAEVFALFSSGFYFHPNHLESLVVKNFLKHRHVATKKPNRKSS